MKPKFFATPEDFRIWLEANHETTVELIVGFWKVGSGRPSMTWSESVDQALCFGWIDGIRKKIDDKSYTIRFTPRRPKSVWSKINMDKVEELKRKGLMHLAGLAAYDNKDESKAGIYSYENRPREFTPELKKLFKKDEEAWKFFETQAPSYQRLAIFWVMSAKQEKTRLTRLDRLIVTSHTGKRI